MSGVEKRGDGGGSGSGPERREGVEGAWRLHGEGRLQSRQYWLGHGRWWEEVEAEKEEEEQASEAEAAERRWVAVEERWEQSWVGRG